MNEGSFECRVSGKRESASGIYLTLQIQPDDYTSDLATMRVGAFLMLGWAEVVNTAVEPIDVVDRRFPDGITPQGTPFMRKAQATSTASEPKANGSSKKFHELPLSQQAAIRCGDVLFQDCLGVESQGAAAERVRVLCGVQTRSLIRAGSPAGDSWTDLEASYQSWLTDRKFSEAKR